MRTLSVRKFHTLWNKESLKYMAKISTYNLWCGDNVTKIWKHLYRVWVLWAFKRGVLGFQKFNFLQKWQHFRVRLELIWRSFFAWMTFYVRFLVFEIWSILYFFSGLAEIWINKIVGGGLRPPATHHRGYAPGLRML